MSDEVELRLTMPSDMVTATYSNMLVVWHTPHDFTLDFIELTGPAQPEEGNEHQVMPGQVVARIKVPVSVIFPIAQAIADNVTKYEESFGPITARPGDGGLLYPPGENDGDNDH